MRFHPGPVRQPAQRPAEAETVLALEQCDMVGSAGPWWPTLIGRIRPWPKQSTRFAAVLPVTRAVLAHVFNNEPMECLVNGLVYWEALLKTEKVMTAKNCWW